MLAAKKAEEDKNLKEKEDKDKEEKEPLKKDWITFFIFQIYLSF